MNKKELNQTYKKLLLDLRNLSVEIGMKQRILDTIDDCIRKAEKATIEEDYRFLDTTFEKIIPYIEKQLREQSEKVTVKGNVQVSKEEIKEEIMKKWREAKKANLEKKNHTINEHKNLCHKLERNMREIANSKEDKKMLIQTDIFSEKMELFTRDYKQRADQIAEQYIDNLSDEYNRSMDKIRDIILQIDYGQGRMSMRDFNEKWTDKHAMYLQDIKNHAVHTDKGEESIKEFAASHRKGLDRIKERNKKKRLLLAVLPFVLGMILVGILTVNFVNLISDLNKEKNNKTNVTEENQEHKDTIDEFKENVKNGAADITKDLIKEGAVTGVSTALTGLRLILGFAIPLILFLLLAYEIYINYFGYKNWMARDTVKYILVQMDKFWSSCCLEQKGTDCMDAIEQNLNQKYDTIFKEMFGWEMNNENLNDPGTKLFEISTQWNNIKKER